MTNRMYSDITCLIANEPNPESYCLLDGLPNQGFEEMAELVGEQLQPYDGLKYAYRAVLTEEYCSMWDRFWDKERAVNCGKRWYEWAQTEYCKSSCPNDYAKCHRLCVEHRELTDFAASYTRDCDEPQKSMYELLKPAKHTLEYQLDDADRMTNAVFTLKIGSALSQGTVDQSDLFSRGTARKALDNLARSPLAASTLLDALEEFSKLSYTIGNFTQLIKHREPGFNNTLNQRKGAGFGEHLIVDGCCVNDQFALFVNWMENYARSNEGFFELYADWLKTMSIDCVKDRYLEAAAIYKAMLRETRDTTRIQQFVNYLDCVNECIRTRSIELVARLQGKDYPERPFQVRPSGNCSQSQIHAL